MAELKTTFMGLELKSPIIASSCGLTADIEKLKEMERNGVGAVVLKSVFEEQIINETSYTLGGNNYPEEEDYIRNYVRANTLQQHINLVMEAKSCLTIPVIASINCIQDGEWTAFAKDLEKAGADALELNVFILAMDKFEESDHVEKIYYNIVRHIKSQVRIPVCIKISHNITNIPAFVDKLKAYGADGVTLFNRFYEPDINIDELTIGVSDVFSTPRDIVTTLKWTGILSGKDRLLQIAASTGVHSGDAAVKLLLAGSTTIQVCSVLYQEGITSIRVINNFLSRWMESKGFTSIEQFRGILSYANHAARYERAQFMKYFSDKKV